ncbi:MAG: LPS assembly protein LptD [Desulfobacteria bacterium]
MRRLSIVISPILIIIILLCYAGYSFSEDMTLGDQKIDKRPIRINADKLEFDGKKNTYITQGNVEIVQDNRVLKADMIKLNQETKEAEATGNITLTTKEDTLKSDRMEINLDTQKGTVYDGRLFFKRENLHLTGKKIEKWDKDRYRIIDGEFTTCDSPSPPWKFTAKEVNVTIEGYATVKHATFYIKDIPVLYLPYIIYPAKIKRQTGLLIPSIGYSNEGGEEITLPFFWAISENMDATFSLDYRSKRGIGEALEYRYIFSRNNSGNLYLYNMREMNSYRDWKEERKGEKLISGLDRTMLRYRHEQYFDPSFSAKADVTHVSDRAFFKDFGRIVDDRSKEKLESTVFATKLWQKFSLNSELRYTEDLEKEDKTTLQSLPRVEFAGSKQSILGFPLFYSLSSALDNFWREGGETGQRVDIYPKLLYTFHTDYFELKPEIGGRETIYRLNEGEDKIYTRQIYDLNLGLITTAFQRIFDVDGERLKKLEHSVKPELKYTFIPDVDQGNLPNFDPVDRIDKKNSLTYSLISNLTGKIYEGTDDPYYHRLVRLKLSQSYNFSDTRTSTDDSRRLFSPVSGELDIYPAKNTSLRLDGEYNTYDSEFTTYNVLIGLKDERGDFLDFEYRNTKGQTGNLDTIPQIGNLNMKLKVKLSDSVDLKIENRYSTLEKLSLETIFGLNYKAQCWGVRGEYSDRVIENEDRREQRFMIFFSLTGLSQAEK